MYSLCKADHAYLTYLMLQRQLSHLNGRNLTSAKFKPLIFFMFDFTLSYTENMLILMIPYYFCLQPAHREGFPGILGI
jgi:hypothetical protein